jgi:hypothetical protein
MRDIADWPDEIDAREREILTLAYDLLNHLGEVDQLQRGERKREQPSEASIDSHFIFRFDPQWYKQAANLRELMRSLLGQSGNEALSPKDGQRWVNHLRRNTGLRDPESGEEFTFLTDQGVYQPLDPELHSVASPWTHTDNEHLRRKLREEATKTFDPQKDLYLLAWEYGVAPGHHELNEWTPSDIERRLARVAACVIYASVGAPLIPWPMARLVPRKTGRGVERVIRLERWPKPAPPVRRMSLDTRVTTWAVYYLSRRGGGKRIEEKAVETWNSHSILDSLRANRFRRDRIQLFKQGTKNRLR